MLKLIVALVKIVVIGLKTMQMENGEYLLHAYFLLSNYLNIFSVCIFKQLIGV